MGRHTTWELDIIGHIDNEAYHVNTKCTHTIMIHTWLTN